MGQICITNDVNFALNFFKNYAETVPFNGAIGDKFSKKYKHQSIKKTRYLMPDYFYMEINLLNIVQVQIMYQSIKLEK